MRADHAYTSEAARALSSTTCISAPRTENNVHKATSNDMYVGSHVTPPLLPPPPPPPSPAEVRASVKNLHKGPKNRTAQARTRYFPGAEGCRGVLSDRCSPPLRAPVACVGGVFLVRRQSAFCHARPILRNLYRHHPFSCAALAQQRWHYVAKQELMLTLSRIL